MKAKVNEVESRFYATHDPGELMPREKLLRDGPQALRNDELVAIQLSTGIRGMDVHALAKKLLSGRTLDQLRTTPAADLQRDFKGIGQAKVCNLLSALELGYRCGAQKVVSERLTCSKLIYDQVRPKIEMLETEEFWLGVCNTQNRMQSLQCLFKGGLGGTPVDTRRLFTVVLRSGFNTFYVAHNHPAGSAHPSQADRDVTKRIADGACLLGLRFLDHIIVAQLGDPTRDSYYSFHDQGEM